LRQDVDQESADELGGGECHDLLAITTVSANPGGSPSFSAVPRHL
jgi:hypothetical protein